MDEQTNQQKDTGENLTSSDEELTSTFGPTMGISVRD